MSQKGGIALIILIIVIVAGLGIGAYFITQKTSWFSNAGSAQITIPYMSPPPTTATTSAQPSIIYQNPFEASSASSIYENPFEAYQNPFENL